MFFPFILCFLSALPLLTLFLASSYLLLTLLMPSGPNDGGFPSPFLPHLHRLSFAYTSPKVRLYYKNFTPTRTRVWICKDTKKMPYREIYFSTICFEPVSQGAGTVSPSSTQGVAKYFPSPCRLHGQNGHAHRQLYALLRNLYPLGKCMGSAGEGWEKCLADDRYQAGFYLVHDSPLIRPYMHRGRMKAE